MGGGGERVNTYCRYLLNYKYTDMNINRDYFFIRSLQSVSL